MRFDPESKLGAILNGAAISGEADFNTLVNLLCVVQAVAHYARDNEPDRETILAACELLGEAAPDV